MGGYIQDLRKVVGHKALFMPCAAGVFIDGWKILLQKRTDDGSWAVHGGGLELGETYLEALKRELREELNIEVTNATFFKCYSGKNLHHIYPNGDEIYGVEEAYIIDSFEGKMHADEDEVSELKWFDIDSLPEDIHKPDIELIDDVIDYIKHKNI